MVIARTGHAERRTGLAVVLRLGHNGASAGLEASVARARAASPFGELGNFAVNLASKSGAGRLLDEAGALITLGAVLEDSTTASPLAHATGFGAGAPRTEFGNLAMIGAVTEVALHVLVLGTAWMAAELFFGDHGAGTSLGAVAAGDGAVTERTPVRHDAVHGARVVVAGGVLEKVRTRFAAVHFRLASNVAYAALSAIAAGLGALSPGTELSHTAIDGAMLCLALLGLGEGRARGAFKTGSSAHLTFAGLLTSATGLGAAAPGGPLADNTIDGARIDVALTSLLQPRAGTTVALVLDGARANLQATAAGLVAGPPLAPFGDHAFNSAWASVAGTRVTGGWAFLATADHGLDDHTGTVLASLAAFGVAEVESRPTGDGAVNGTLHRVTLGSVGEVRADVAAVLGVTLNGTGAGLFTAPAGLGAFRERGPLADGAVSGARTGVAGTSHEGVATLLAAELGSDMRLAFTTLAAMTAGLVAFSPILPSGKFAVDRALY